MTSFTVLEPRVLGRDTRVSMIHATSLSAVEAGMKRRTRFHLTSPLAVRSSRSLLPAVPKTKAGIWDTGFPFHSVMIHVACRWDRMVSGCTRTRARERVEALDPPTLASPFFFVLFGGCFATRRRTVEKVTNPLIGSSPLCRVYEKLLPSHTLEMGSNISSQHHKFINYTL